MSKKELAVTDRRALTSAQNGQLGGRPRASVKRLTERTRKNILDRLAEYVPEGETATLFESAESSLAYLVADKKDPETIRWFFNQYAGTPTSRVELVQFPEAESLRQMAWAVYDGIHISDEDDDFFLTDEQKDKLYKRCIRLFVDKIDPEMLPSLGASS